MRNKLLQFLAFVLLLLTTVAAKANPIDVRQAREVGAKFVSANTAMRVAADRDLQWVTTYRTANNDAAFHVFNTPKGFVIVSADDCATPILGYSEEGHFSTDNVPPQMQEYLQSFVDQIQYAVDNRLPADETVVRQWELVRTTGNITEQRATTAVAPLLSDTWNQDCYYNNLCPTDSDGPCGHVYAGCVATSFAQIMHYWGHPSTGVGSHTYTPEGYPQQTANFGATTYQWNNMPNDLNSSSTSTQVNAVATLIWHCGVAVDMMYAPDGSGAYSEDVATALVNYFDYSNDLTGIYKNYYSDEQWLSMIKGSLDLGRPVHYSGHGSGGHAFVCDGYDNNNYLHFNWGWSGSYNNYFALGALTPGSHNYSNSNFAIINIHPNCAPGTSYQVTATASPSYGGTVTGGGSYGCGDACTLTATPANGYMFCSWTEGGVVVSTETSYFFTVMDNRNLVANFTYTGGDACTLVFNFLDSYGDGWNGNALAVSYSSGCTDYEELTLDAGASGTFTRNVLSGSHITLGWIEGNWGYECSFTVSYEDGTVICQGSNLSSSYFYEFDVNCDGTPPTPPPGDDPVYVTTTPTNRNVILEEFTGRNCGYCTDGHRIANEIMAANPDRVWAINVHAGGYAPTTYPNFNTTDGNTIHSGFTISGYPTGVVNRSTAEGQSRGIWTSLANTQLSQIAECNVGGEVIIDAATRTASITVEVYYTSNSSYNQNYLTVAMLQDSILGSQADYGDYNPTQWLNGQYVHMHILRDIITPSAWGEAISPTTQGSLITRTYTYEIPETIGSPNGVDVDLSNIYFLAWVSETYQGTPTRPILTACELTNNSEFTSYNITATASPANAGTVSGAGSYVEGSTCTLMASANSGYVFSNWTKNGTVVSTSSTYSFTVTQNATYVANFTVYTPPAPTLNVFAEYYPDANDPNSPYVKVYWEESSGEPFEAQIGEGNSTFGYFPFYTLYNYSIAENLFLASELQAAGVTMAPMTSLSWYATNAPGYAQQGISIWMANVSDMELTTTSHTVDGMTLVYTGDMTPEIGWNEFVFNEGTFAWDGYSNVLIFCQRNNGSWNSTVYWQADNVGFAASSYKYQDSEAYDVTVPNTMTTSTVRPNIIMKSAGRGNRDEFTYDFESGMQGWTSIDADGDGYDWMLASSTMGTGYGHNGSSDMVLSQSYNNQVGSLNPDNYLISPQIALGGCITFFACAQDNAWAAEHFGVAVSTTSNTDASAFTTIQEWTMTAKGAGTPTNVTRSGNRTQGNWYQYTVDLSAYAGQMGYVAIRHFNCSDWFYLDIDDITISSDGGSSSGYSIYRANCDGSNAMLIANEITENEYIDYAWSEMDFGNYKYGVVQSGSTIKWSNCIEKPMTDGCTIYFDLYDSYGDGWNGNCLVVDYGNGVTEQLTIQGGSSATYSRPIEDGSHVALSWILGSWLNECSFTIHYADGTPIYESLNLGSEFEYEFDVNCAGPYNIYNINASAMPADGGTVTGGGTYYEGQVCTLSATLNEGYEFLNWTKNGVEVSTELSFSFTVTEAGNYVAHFASEGYYWEYDHYAYPDNMTVTGVIQIEGVEQRSSYLEVGAFCNGECRGRERPSYNSYFDRYIMFFSIYGTDGDQIEFRLYDHATGMESTLACETVLTFHVNDVYGNIVDPFALNFVGAGMTQTTSFASGWNWWSGYVELGANGLNALEEGLETNGMMIKSQNDGYASYLAGYGWYGSLTSINNESTYQVRVGSACEVELSGMAANPADHPITLHNGWTWIGYPVGTTLGINEALSGITPTNGDMLKSQNNGYASYLAGYGWYGSLNTITPGMGLMYKSNNTADVTLVYPSNGTRAGVEPNQTTDDNHWRPNLNAYPDNMSVMAVVELDDQELRSERYELAAFANGEVRGSARLMYVEPIDRYMAFLTVAGDDVTELTFGLYDAETGTEIMDCAQAINFSVNAVAGSFAEPYVVSFRGTTGMDEWAKSLQVYPNPVAAGDVLNLSLAENTGEVRIEIVNILGAVVETMSVTSLQTALKAPNAVGVYTLRITAEGKGTCCRKLVVK